MKLNHVNLTVTDVPQTRRLFETYFGLTRSRELGNENFDVMFDDDGSAITLMKSDEVSYPKTFHVGFIQESEEQVNEINQRLKDDGFDVKPPKRFHGSWTFYFRAPGGFMIEVPYDPRVAAR
jgi:lactoylglutathione lyase